MKKTEWLVIAVVVALLLLAWSQTGCSINHCEENDDACNMRHAYARCVQAVENGHGTLTECALLWREKE
jgi:hypothetical protein